MRATFLFSDRAPEDWHAEQVPRVGELLFFDHGSYEVAAVRHYFSTNIERHEAPHRVEIIVRAR